MSTIGSAPRHRGRNVEVTRCRASNDLFSRSKDLRVAVVLAQALLHVHRFRGLDKGISITHGLLTRYWDSVYPQLDPEDNNDPTARVNALLDLCGRETFLNPLRVAPLARSRVFGVVSLRDVEIAEGKVPAPAGTDKPALDSAAIGAAFQDCEIDQLQDTATAIASALGSLNAIETIVTEHVGPAQAPDLSPLATLLMEAQGLLKTRLADRAARSDESLESSANAAAAELASGETRPEVPPQRVSGEVTNRQDVVRMLDKVCECYARYEPSSPVPLLLQRARRLVTKDFLEIMHDLAPDAVAQIEAIRGSDGDE